MIEDISRILLSLTCFGSALVAVRIAVKGANVYRWVMVFTAHWSAWFGLGILTLAIDSVTLGLGDPLFVAGLNSSASATVGGWTVAAWMNWRRSARALAATLATADDPNRLALLVRGGE